MHEFKYKGIELYCENVNLETIARKIGTPTYVYSLKTLRDHFHKIKQALKPVNPLICFSAKSNSNSAVLRALVKEGAGVDIVSGGELYRAKRIGANPKKIVFAGVGKTEEEITKALRAGILFFNTESEVELIAINNIARKLRKTAKVALRVNPNVDALTHKHITTGKSENKFGIDLISAKKIYFGRKLYKNIDLCGIHVHIGSQIIQGTPYVQMLKILAAFIKDLKKCGIKLTHLNIGGGLGIIYYKEKPQTAKEFAKKVIPILKSTGLKIIMEPGRFISGNSGVLLTQVTYIKKSPKKQFAIVDAAMNDLLRPTLYEAYHQISPLNKKARSRQKYDFVGPICESGDFFAKARVSLKLEPRDYVAIMSSGAYGFTMSSNYNSRLLAAEVLVSGNKFYVVRNRQTLSDLTRNERIPGFLK